MPASQVVPMPLASLQAALKLFIFHKLPCILHGID